MVGMILGGTCQNCGYTANLKLGGGLRDCETETALEAARSTPQLEELTAALHKGCQFQINRFPAACGKCKTLRTAARVVWFPPDGEARMTAASCPDCGGRMDWYGQGARIVRCPSCGQRIHLAPIGHWD